MIPPIKLDGKNLLIYGENGSGKSTLFEALYQLLDSSEKLAFDNKNCFTDEALAVGRVVLNFSVHGRGVAVPSMEWNIRGSRPTNHLFYRTMARQCGFLDYRAMLRMHFVHRDSDGINLFPLVVEILLREVEYPTALATFGKEWAEIQRAGHEWLELAVRDVRQMDDAEKIRYGLEPPDPSEDGEESPPYDEASEFQAYVDAQRDLIATRIKTFNDALWQRVLEIQTAANRFIKGLDPFLDIDFEYSGQLKQLDVTADPPWPGEPQLLLRWSSVFFYENRQLLLSRNSTTSSLHTHISLMSSEENRLYALSANIQCESWQKQFFIFPIYQDEEDDKGNPKSTDANPSLPAAAVYRRVIFNVPRRRKIPHTINTHMMKVITRNRMIISQERGAIFPAAGP